MTTRETRELQRLQCALADRLDIYPTREWGPAMLHTVISLIDLHFAEDGTDRAPRPRVGAVIRRDPLVGVVMSRFADLLDMCPPETCSLEIVWALTSVSNCI